MPETDFKETKRYKEGFRSLIAELPVPGLVGYGFTLIIEVLLTEGLYYLLPHFPLARYPIPYVLVMMLVAYLFGEGPAILAFLLGIVLYGYFFVGTPHALWPLAVDPMGWASWVAFLMGTAIVGFATLQMRRSKGNIQRLLLQVEDELTERVQAENALVESEELYKKLAVSAELGRSQLEAVINSIAQGVFVLDTEGRIITMNPAVMKLYNGSAADVIGHRLDSLIGKSDISCLDGSPAPSIPDLVGRVTRGETIENLELLTTRRDNGRSFMGSYSASSVMDSSGMPALTVILVSDITERVVSEQRGKELDRHKMEFYRRTLLAATNGRLVITDESSIAEIAGEPAVSWDITSAGDIAAIRHRIADIADEHGMDDLRINRFIVSIGEAATNAVKHAKSGKASVHQTAYSMIFIVSDRGAGIATLNLPDLALRERYSTAGTLGMGYKVILSFCDKVYLSTSPDGTTVALEMRYREPEGLLIDDMAALQYAR